jgi:hypothetical protein
MADEWIKFRKKLIRDGRVVAIARKCNAPRVTVIGALVALWCLADDNCDENGVLYGYAKEDINAEVGVENFVESLPIDWFSVVNGVAQLPMYQEHNGSTAKKRACNARRVTNLRIRRGKCNAASVTREEKRREDKKKEKKEARKRAGFVRPTVEEVASYCKERSCGVDPEAFVNFYESKGWVVGKTPMKDWKASVRTWERNRSGSDNDAPQYRFDLKDDD